MDVTIEIKKGFMDEKKNEEVQELLFRQAKVDRKIAKFVKEKIERIPEELVKEHNDIADKLDALADELVKELRDRTEQTKAKKPKHSAEDIEGLVKCLRRCADQGTGEDCSWCPNRIEEGNDCQDTMMRDAAEVIEQLIREQKD